MAAAHVGALIVIAQDSDLKFYAESGDELDAMVSKRLLLSIFNKYSPMHDGAVIIHKGRVQAARCILPVSESDQIPAAFGLRHRAAIGLSEVADAIVLVVSEETGQVSLVRSGELLHNLSMHELRSKLNLYLFAEDEVEKKEVTPEVA
jgi:DNA integrity scanning protein DisA with diadenylate cyclase activity